MRKYVKSLLACCLGLSMILNSFPIYASDSMVDMSRGTYMSSATVYATVDGEDDVIGRAVVTCLAQVREIDVDMYLQRAYGNVWKNVTSAYNINRKDLNELDEAAIIHNVSPGTYRVYIEVAVIGYDGLMDSVGVGTGAFIIYT